MFLCWDRRDFNDCGIIDEDSESWASGGRDLFGFNMRAHSFTVFPPHTWDGLHRHLPSPLPPSPSGERNTVCANQSPAPGPWGDQGIFMGWGESSGSSYRPLSSKSDSSLTTPPFHIPRDHRNTCPPIVDARPLPPTNKNTHTQAKTHMGSCLLLNKYLQMLILRYYASLCTFLYWFSVWH